MDGRLAASRDTIIWKNAEVSAKKKKKKHKVLGLSRGSIKIVKYIFTRVD